MKHPLLTSFILYSFVSQAQNADVDLVVAAAMTADHSVTWQSKSVVSGDFTCQGMREFAILGTKPKEIVVGVFRPPSLAPVDLLRYSGEIRNPKSAVLATETLDFDVREFGSQVGYVPDGLQVSKTCLGLNMSDQMIDSAHIYWHRKHKRFVSWSL